MLKHRYPSKSKTKGGSRSATRELEKQFNGFSLPQSDRNHSIEEYFIALDTPVSLSCLILFRHGEFTQLVQKEIDPIDYIDRFKFRDDFAAVSFLRKNKFLKTDFDLKQVALTAFQKSEDQCEGTNRRFQNLSLDPLFRGPNVWLLNALTRKIDMILNHFDPLELFDRGSWGPGVTTQIKGSNVAAPRKFREERGITSSAYRLVGHLLPLAYPHWFDEEKLSGVDILPGNKVITVPKNAKTDRTIGIEPGLNSWFQLSMGKIIRRKLSLAGFNLNSDARNQRSCYIGSLDDTLATVDFSSASDTISKRLVEEVLPPRWFNVLDALRSQCYELNGKWLPAQKFSAMGNGFTFELESLIFVSAALVTVGYLGLDDSSVSVFGDDIIIPKEAFPLYSSFCKFLGFTVNQKKSFSSGLFRESCGAYYFDGLDVKPLFLKEDIRNAKSIYRLANSIRHLAHRRNSYYGCDRRLVPVWLSLVRRIPKALRALGPANAGDSAIHVNFDEGCPVVAPNQWCGYLYPGFVAIPCKGSDDTNGLFLARLWRPSRDQAYGNMFDLRAITKIRFRKRNFTAQWYNFGPWI